MAKNTFTMSDLQKFWDGFRDTLQQDVNNGTYESVREGYLQNLLDVMGNEMITSATSGTLCFLRWAAPIRGRTEPFEIYAFSSDEKNNSIDIFVPLFTGNSMLCMGNTDAVKRVFGTATKFLRSAIEGKVEVAWDNMDASLFIEELRGKLFDQINFFVLTDQVFGNCKFKQTELTEDISFNPQIFDINRYYSAARGHIRDEVQVNFEEMCAPLDAVVIQEPDYDCYMVAIPGNVVKSIYSEYGGRIVEANVRSFLTFRRNVNKGIRTTIEGFPENFIAYNNGLVITANQVLFKEDPTSHRVSLTGLVGPQIVNGGQTTFAISKADSEKLQKVWVPAKVIDLQKLRSQADGNGEKIEAMLQSISRSANTQNTVQQSDLTSNSPWNKKLEMLADKVVTKTGSRWYFERTAGSFSTYKYDKTKTELKKIAEEYPEHFNKSDVAKYINTWRGEPTIVALGKEKNHVRFVDNYVTAARVEALDAEEYRKIVAKAIVYRTVYKTIRDMNITHFPDMATYYLIALMAKLYGDRFDLNNVWLTQKLSKQLVEQVKVWAQKLVEVFNNSLPKGGNMTEWAKTNSCWSVVQANGLTEPAPGIPEILAE